MNLHMTIFISEIFLNLGVITDVGVRGMIFKCNVLGWYEVLFVACFQESVLDIGALNISLSWFIQISNRDVLRLG